MQHNQFALNVQASLSHSIVLGELRVIVSDGQMQNRNKKKQRCRTGTEYFEISGLLKDLN